MCTPLWFPFVISWWLIRLRTFSHIYCPLVYLLCEVFILIFYLLDLSVSERGILKSPTKFLGLSIYCSNSIFGLIYFELYLGKLFLLWLFINFFQNFYSFINFFQTLHSILRNTNIASPGYFLLCFACFFNCGNKHITLNLPSLVFSCMFLEHVYFP